MDPAQFTRISKALADPTRMEILERIAAENELACSSLAGECQVSQPTISHHLKELAAAGLISTRREGKFYFYQLDRKLWAEYLSTLRKRVR